MTYTDKEIVDVLHTYYPQLYNEICDHLDESNSE